MLEPQDIKKIGKVAVIMGGWSSEREVSLMSGAGVLSALQSQGIEAYAVDARSNHELISELMLLKPDRAFIIMHGVDGESGTLQAILEGLEIPYTGSKVAACAITLDKLRTKWLMKGAGLPTPDFVMLNEQTKWETVVKQLGLPLFVKPTLDGSSLGISKVTCLEELIAAYHHAKQYLGLVMAERFVSGSEYTVSIVGDLVLPSIRIATPHIFYDYDAKYFVDTTEYLCPSDLSATEEKQLADLAWKIYQACGCTGWGRVDFMRDEQGNFMCIELNTAPGMTSHSLVPKAANAMGISYQEVVLQVLNSALKKNETELIH